MLIPSDWPKVKAAWMRAPVLRSSSSPARNSDSLLCQAAKNPMENGSEVPSIGSFNRACEQPAFNIARQHERTDDAGYDTHRRQHRHFPVLHADARDLRCQQEWYCHRVFKG